MSQNAIKLGVVMDPIADITYKKDTTLTLLWAAEAMGWSLYYLEQEDLYLYEGRAMGSVRPLKVHRDPQHWYDLGEREAMPLGELDVILMRKDPPVDSHFLNAVHLLAFAEREGTLVVNPTRALFECNEKLFAQQFAHCIPPTVVSCRDAVLRAFQAEHGDTIFKPLDGMGGTGIFHIGPDGRNLGAVIEQLTERGQRQIMAQRYLPEAREGDKRIILVDGEPVGACLRVPTGVDHRANIHVGARCERSPLTGRDREICARIGPDLKNAGQIFVGIDVIGDKLTEVNVTSPTGIREIANATDLNLAEELFDCIETKINQRQTAA